MNVVPRLAFSLFLLISSIQAHADEGQSELPITNSHDRYHLKNQPDRQSILPVNLKLSRDRHKHPHHVVPADLIASAGHGVYLDKDGNEIEMTDKLRADIQDAIIELLLPHAKKNLNRRLYKKIRYAARILEKQRRYQKRGRHGRYGRHGGHSRYRLSMDQRLILQSAVLFNLIDHVPVSIQEDYGWRQRLLFEHVYTIYQKKPKLNRFVKKLLKYFSFKDFVHAWMTVDPKPSSYVERCRADGVPVPNEWSEDPASGWKYQGELTEKLIIQGSAAHVWTWTDDSTGGGCIALPRGDGGPGDLAGIICQSESSGKACFWDNKLKSNPVQTGIGWAGLVLTLDELHDGDTLTDNCTDCHRGDNVFIISPDDATWRRTINRDNAAYDSGLFFTTQLPAGMRYEPVSSQEGWGNPEPITPSCAGACHEQHELGFTTVPPMPPVCASPNVEACYSD